MPQARYSVSRPLRLLALVAALVVPAQAFADDYTDVNQLLRSGRQADALAKADQYLAAKPRDPQMRFLRGVILTESGKTQDAIATFVKLTEDYPELPEPYNNLAVLYAGQSQFDKARAALEMAIRTNPSYSTAHENLGDVYAKLASQAYSKALQLDGSNSAVQPKLALIRDLFAPGPRGARPATPAAAVPATAPAIAAAAPSAAPAATAAASAKAPAAAGALPAATAPATAARPPSAPASPAVGGTAVDEVEAAVMAWARAWSARDMQAYLGAYGADFDPPGKQSRKAWEEERRARIVPRSRISVRVSGLDVDVDGSKATAKFRQAYSADGLNINGKKTLELHKVGDRWLIVRESVG